MDGGALPTIPPSILRGLEALPEELLVKIATRLGHDDTSKRSNFRSLSLASKRLLGSCNLACHALALSGLKAARVPRLLARFADLASLNLSFLFDCNEDTLAAVGRHCPRLRELHVPENIKPGRAGSMEAAPGAGLLAVCLGCPNLDFLALPAYKGPAVALQALGAARRLRVLQLRGAVNLDDAVVAHIAAHCHSVEVLDLSFNAIGDEALASLGEGMPQLRQLDLKHCKRVTGAGIALLARGCLRLRTLHLGVLDLDDAALVALGQHSSELVELSLDYGTGARGHFSQEALAALAQGCGRLRVLSLRGSKQVGDQALRGLARGCPALEELDLHACADIGDLGLHSAVLGCKRLRSLVLTGTGVGPGGLATFEGGLPLLAELRLNGELITDAVLRSVARACPALRELHLSGGSVGDGGLGLLLRACLRLHTLVLKACADVKGTAFEGAVLPDLQIVQLPSCGITDQGLLALTAAAPSLTSLTLSGCTKLTADGCAVALRAAQALSALVATSCKQLERADVLRLVRAAGPTLKTMRVSRPGSPDDEYTLKRISVGWALPCWARGGLGASASAKY